MYRVTIKYKLLPQIRTKSYNIKLSDATDPNGTLKDGFIKGCSERGGVLKLADKRLIDNT